MSITNIESRIREKEIFKNLTGKSFVAVSVLQKENGSNFYQWHFNEITDELALFACEHVKKYILDSCE